MRVLIISHYYPPDLSAGSFRTGALVQCLLEKLGPGDSVRVLTAAPNRYATFIATAPEVEGTDRLTIERIRLPSHANGMKGQLLAFFTFAREVMRRSKGEQADIVYATSSRLGTAALGAWVARRCAARLHLDIRDLFAHNMSNILTGPSRLLLPFIRALEKMTLRSADQISIVSPGFREHVVAQNPRIEPLMRTNGIDEEFLGPDFDAAGNAPPLILYAGNIGDGQGLSRVVPEAARRLCGRFRFRIIGDGGRRNELERRIRAVEAEAGHKLDIELHPPVGREQLIVEYSHADVLLVHLNDYPAFRLVLPSKLFEYGATGKPILAGLGGVSAEFASRHLPNTAIFDPCDVDGLVAALDRLSLGWTDRSKFLVEFRRKTILGRLAEEIVALGRP